jgi:hypothetical protein
LTATSTPTNSATFTASPSATLLILSFPTNTPLLFPTTLPSITPLPSPNLVILTATPSIGPSFVPLPATRTPLPGITPLIIVPPSPIFNTALPFSSPLPGTPFVIAPLPTDTPFAAVGRTAVAAFPTVGFASNTGEFLGVAGGTVQRPPAGTADLDVSRFNRRSEILADGRLLIDGGTYVGDNKHNRQRFIQARWSSDGNWLAYIVQTPGAVEGQFGVAQAIDDGVWVLEVYSGRPPTHVLRNHYIPGSNEYPYRVAYRLNWASDSDALMVEVTGPGGLPMSILTGKGRNANETAPGLFQLRTYSGATWVGSSGYVVTTTDPNQSVKLGFVSRNNGEVQAILDGAFVGLWMQNAAQLADGRYGFLAKPNAAGRLEGGASGLRLYVYSNGGQPTPVSEVLPGTVVSAEWNPSRTALLANLRLADGRLQTVVVASNGGITYINNGSINSSWRR